MYLHLTSSYLASWLSKIVTNDACPPEILTNMLFFLTIKTTGKAAKNYLSTTFICISDGCGPSKNCSSIVVYTSSTPRPATERKDFLPTPFHQSDKIYSSRHWAKGSYFPFIFTASSHTHQWLATNWTDSYSSNLSHNEALDLL